MRHTFFENFKLYTAFNFHIKKLQIKKICRKAYGTVLKLNVGSSV